MSTQAPSLDQSLPPSYQFLRKPEAKRYWDDPKAKVLFGLFVAAMAVLAVGTMAYVGVPLGISFLAAKFMMGYGAIAVGWIGYAALRVLNPNWQKRHFSLDAVIVAVLFSATILVSIGLLGGFAAASGTVPITAGP